ncbi:MAG: hypothetical protein IPG60_08880 [Bacteroidetes bacterium]|nr:hypothetical protein [Bacteroidota bacterium]MBP7398071.1 hypothetical protein [Chitinophagales bacterium]MBK7109328.1 hypothetical protein [Bacteroidota bacterium]MBK8487928.1 hypothetical protein [Bacteroidota bacterium]MBK8682317.1 hypothetical protein [Bacteroidota bacterium]
MNISKSLTRRDKFFWVSIGIITVMVGYLISNIFIDKRYDYSNFILYKYKNRFEIFVPGYLVPDDSLSANASLQFSDFSNEVFLLVIEENKKELQRNGITPSAKEYYAYILESISSSIENFEIVSEKTTRINGLQTLTCEINGTYADHTLYYLFSVVESENAYYQLLAWTTDAVKNVMKRDFYASFTTFKEE